MEFHKWRDIKRKRNPPKVYSHGGSATACGHARMSEQSIHYTGYMKSGKMRTEPNVIKPVYCLDCKKEWNEII